MVEGRWGGDDGENERYTTQRHTHTYTQPHTDAETHMCAYCKLYAVSVVRTSRRRLVARRREVTRESVMGVTCCCVGGSLCTVGGGWVEKERGVWGVGGGVRGGGGCGEREKGGEEDGCTHIYVYVYTSHT